ncbi:MAG: hypothetical protein HY064_15590 [Bacteroidetes bacterium]|nr:hypothetical protein [Bacteroidota bacterium]
MRFQFYLFFVIFFPFSVHGQGNYSLKIIEIGNENVLKHIDYKKDFPDKISRENEMHNVLATLWNESYLEARYDSLLNDSLSITAYLFAGEKYSWASLSKGNVDEGILSDIGYREKLYRNKPLKYKDVAKIENGILNWCDDHGYPFASVKLDSCFFVNDRSLNAQLHLQKNRFTKIDSVVVVGSLKLSRSYLFNYIGISPGDPYDENKVDAITKRIKELPFAKSTKPYTILFTEKYTKLTLYLDKKPSGQFDGVVGFLPDSRTGKILFTGDARLRLQNSFTHGEVIDINWRRLQEQTQDLKAHVNYPYLFRTPVGIDYTIKLYRRDTTYIDVNQNFGLQYLFSAGTSLTAFVKQRNSNLISTAGMENLTTLPQYADISATTYGLTFHREQLDYRFNPRKGYVITATADAGDRVIHRNAKLNPVIYDNIDLKTTQYSAAFDAEKFWPFGKRSTIRTSLQSATIYNNGGVFKNELYRIGGLRTLRGFDEESIYASSYAIVTAEYRFLLEENSAFFLFADGCWYENNLKTSFVTDTPFGFGTGVFFETKAGIFTMTYALGDQFNQGIKFRDGKVHVGFVGMF